MADQRFQTAWDVAKWIEANVPDIREQGHKDPMDAALWWHAAQQTEFLREMSGREQIRFMRDGSTPVHPDDINNDIQARHEDAYEQHIEDTHKAGVLAEPFDSSAVDQEIEDALRDFWFHLQGERS